MPLEFSLVLATINRTRELERFLRSLADQSLTSFEVLLIDQNPSDLLSGVLDVYEDEIHLIHLRSEPGLSRSRNLGLSKVRGEIVGFPDDDCWYPPGVLERIRRLFATNPNVDGVTGQVQDSSGRSIARFGAQRQYVNSFNVWQRGSSVSMFLRRKVVHAVGDFDETLGPARHH
jgi:glycosyltransferase involved in cell wall biosynthesis